jgi:uncharacterized protein
MSPRRFVIRFIEVYSRFVSPMLPPSCRYWPTCSEYTVQAVRKYGVIRGSLMGTLRILRCNPWSKGGIDPIR